MTTDTRFSTMLAYLMRGGAYGHYWRDDKTSQWFAVGELVWPQLTEGINLYFGVHPVSEANPREVHTRSRIDTIAAINCVFAEFDAADLNGSKRGLKARVDALPLRASIVIDSGGGYHAYWLLREPYLIRNDAERAFARQFQSDWVKAVGGDPAARDLARVLRVPGTVNWKPKYAPNFPRVMFVEADFDRVYDLAQFDDLLVEHKSKSTPAQIPTPPPAQPLDLSDIELLNRARNADNGAKFQALWSGDTSAHNGDHSAADLSLCEILAFWLQKDPERIDRAFRQSDLMRDKWDVKHFADGRTYGQATIERAIASCSKGLYTCARAASHRRTAKHA
jgi:hypothetical protein